MVNGKALAILFVALEIKPHHQGSQETFSFAFVGIANLKLFAIPDAPAVSC